MAYERIAGSFTTFLALRLWRGARRTSATIFTPAKPHTESASYTPKPSRPLLTIETKVRATHSPTASNPKFRITNSELRIDLKAKGISAWIFRFERAANVQEMERLWRVMFRALKNPAYENLRREIIIWLETCVLPVRKISGAKVVVERLKEEEKMTVVTAEMEDWTLPYINQGIKQGRAEGERIGELRGKLKGELQERTKVILKMIAEGFEDNLIARLVSVPLSEVKKLRITSRRNGG